MLVNKFYSFLSKRKTTLLAGALLATTLLAFQNCGDSAFRVAQLSSLADGANESPRSFATAPYAVAPAGFSAQGHLNVPAVSANGHALTWDGRVGIFSRGGVRAITPSDPLQTIAPGQLTLKTAERRTIGDMTLVMQRDGNAVLYDLNNNPLWSSKTVGLCQQCLLAFQADGNLVIYDTSVNPQKAVWSSQTVTGVKDLEFFNHSPYLAISSNNNRVLFPLPALGSAGWFAEVFRAENMAAADPNSASSIETTLQQSFSDAHPWAIPNVANAGAYNGYEVLELPVLNALSISPDPAYAENPYRSDAAGAADPTGGAFMTYKTRIYCAYNPGTGKLGDTSLGFVPVTIIVNQPLSVQADIQSIHSDGPFQPLVANNSRIRGIEPSVTFDGQLLVYQNWENNANAGHVYYVYNSSPQAPADGWSAPQPITAMFNDANLRKKYPVARYPMRMANGSAFSTVLGAYPWISLDGTDIFFSAARHEDGARRAGVSAVGASTKGLVRLIDGGPNVTRHGNFHRLFMSSLGRTPGRWSPLEFADAATLPLTDKLFTYPMFASNDSLYFEPSFEETVVGNYDLYLDMTEGLLADGEYDKSVTADVSGHFHPGLLNASALYIEEAFPTLCTDLKCPVKDARDPSSRLFSGQPMYFKSDGAVTVNSTSPVTGHVILKDATQLTVSVAVLPVRAPSVANSSLVRKADTFRIGLDQNMTARVRVIVGSGASTQELVLTSLAPLPLNKWSHLAVTYDTKTGNLQLFVNGGLEVEKLFPTAGLPIKLSGSNVIVGPGEAASAGFSYALDQVGVSRVVRTPAEIARQANLVRLRGRKPANPLPLGLKAKDLGSEVLLNRALNAESVKLGQSLFFDPRLSADNKVSCASCHDPNRNFAEDVPLHADRLAAAGGPQHLLRNTPSLLNLGFRTEFFRDGRAPTLQNQARKVMTNPDEMGNDLNAVLTKLQQSNYYRGLFQAAYPGVAQPINDTNLLAALREFELSLTAGDSKFDQYMAGNLTALSTSERLGKALFFGKARCAECHTGSAFTDNSFHNLSFLPSANPDGVTDLGRNRITSSPEDVSKFLTPSLRNVAETAPFFHDGSVANLEAVILKYTQAEDVIANNGASDDGLAAISLSQDEMTNLAAFVRALSSAPPAITAPAIPDLPPAGSNPPVGSPPPPQQPPPAQPPAPTPTPTPQPGLTDTASFSPGGLKLAAHEAVTLANYKLAMQPDGNLVLKNSAGQALWSTHTNSQACTGSGLCRAAFQMDGNLVVYNNTTPLWSTHTENRGRTLTISPAASPKIQITDASGAVIWSVP